MWCCRIKVECSTDLNSGQPTMNLDLQTSDGDPPGPETNHHSRVGGRQASLHDKPFVVFTSLLEDKINIIYALSWVLCEGNYILQVFSIKTMM